MNEPVGRRGHVRLGEKPVLPPPEKPLEFSPDSALPSMPEAPVAAQKPEKVAATAPVAADMRVERQAAPIAADVEKPVVQVVMAETPAKEMPKKKTRTRAMATFDDDEAAVVALDPRRSTRT